MPGSDVTAERRDADLIIRGPLVTMNAAREVIGDGAVAIAGDLIVAVVPRASVTARSPAPTLSRRPAPRRGASGGPAGR